VDEKPTGPLLLAELHDAGAAGNSRRALPHRFDGVEATREILRRHPGMPVVAMTGWEYEERALEVREAGAVDYVSKGRLGRDLVEVLVAAARARRRAPEW
jgi:DNA-binding NarL/FixJ family response regulator